MRIKKCALVFWIFFFIMGLSFYFGTKVLAARPAPSSAVAYTAPITLNWLAKAGVPEAVEYIQYIDAEAIVRPKNILQYERVEKINKIYQEIRYSSLNDFIESENFNNVMDLGCGVSPRFLKMADKKINYVGVDLKDVVNVLNIYAPNFIKDDKKKYANFIAADVSVESEMLNAAKNFDGKVCIISEDLFMYLSLDQQKSALKNIRDILARNGGCFVTSDFVAADIFMSVNKAVYGEKDAQIIAGETQKLYENVSQILFDNTMFGTDEEAVNFIESAGLKVKMYPLFNNAPDIISIRDLNNSDIEKIHAVTDQKFLWVITLAE